MLRQERYEDPQTAMLLTLQGWQSEIYTALPGIIESVDLDKNTCVVQPAIQGIFRLKDGAQKVVNLPLCLDVPIVWPRGGGYTLTFPLKKGDEGAILFMSRCFDAWWQNGGIQPQAEIRMHSLSDGYFIPGGSSQPKKLANVSADNVQLRADDGSSYVEIAAAAMTLKHPTKVIVDTPQAEFTGKVEFKDDVTMDKKLTVSDLTTVGAGTEFVKLASGANATKLKSS